MKITKTFIIIITFFALANFSYSQSKLEKINKLPILTIGNEQITYEQLEKAYQKNISKQKPNLYLLEKDSLLDFINLYSNYRLKVQDALSRGLDKDSSIRAESLQNRRILAESYLFEKEVTDPYVTLMTERRKTEYKIAVIFTTFPQVPERDTIQAFSKITEALTNLKAGGDFSDLAQKYCDDENLARKGGVVDQWVTSGKISREIEDAIYTLEKGQFYPSIIATPYGYFIVKVIDKQPRYFIMGGHILFKQFIRPEDSVNTAELAYPALDRIKKGESFEEIARKESADKFTGEKGGIFEDLYSRSTGFEKSKGMLDPAFSDAMFNLKDNEVSKVVTTDYGNHIVKRFYREEINLDKEREEVRKIFKKQYFEFDKKAYLDKITSKMNFTIFNSNLDELILKLDTNQSNFSKNWADSLPGVILSKTLFSISSKNITIKDFVHEMITNTSLKGFATNKEGIKSAIKKYIEPQVIEFATVDLENKYPDFKQLLAEFNDGILLFKVETSEVWDKLAFDSVAARKYYETNKKDFVLEPKYDISEIYVLSDSLAQEVYKRAINGENFDTLAALFTQRTGYREKSGKWGVISSKTNKLGKIVVEKNIKNQMILQPTSVENGFSIIKVNQYFASRPKTFEEAIPDFATKLQDQKQKALLKNWLSNLRQKFPVKLNNNNIDLLIKTAKEK